ncbi:MAG: hypothetical protein JW820_09705 [Spirochaetales bacterium]|nr:hypothetical protein [Spirochaetales bacterium]
MRRRVLLGWAIAHLLLVQAALLPADTLQDIDKAVAQLGAFVRGAVPDRAGLSIVVLAFNSDKLGRSLLGDRLKNELELNLAANYSRTRIISQPEATNTYTVAGEIQEYPGTVRVLCRVTRPDGSLGGGSRADIPSSPELQSLLATAGALRPGTPAGPGGQGLHDLPPQAGQGALAPEDPLEPDDIPGFEVEVPEGGLQIYSRGITQGDIDRFRFYLPDTATVVLEVQTPIDLQLLLFREGENVPLQVAGTRGNEALRLPVSLPEGHYVVEVLAYDLNVVGPYTLAVDLSARSNDDFEPDDQREQARPIFPGNRQQRALLPGDQDWAELSFTAPGFYGVYTEGLQVDTRIEVYEDSGRLISEDDEGGSAANAFVGLFLGVRRAYVRVTGKGTLDSGSYTLVFEKIEPAQVYPSSQFRTYPVEPNPLFLRLRVLQPGRYAVEVLPDARFLAGPGETASLELYALPAMRRLTVQGSLFVLGSGDYLIRAGLPEGGGESFALCVASEEEAEECRGAARESGYGHPHR